MGDQPRMLITARHLTAAIALVVLAAVGALVLVQHDGSHGSTVRGSGIPATETRSVGPFDGVELAGSNTIMISVGSPRRVVVHADTNLLSHVTTSVRSGRLVVGNTPGSFATVMPMSVEVTVPSVALLRISGSGSISVGAGSTPRLLADIEGSGQIGARSLTARAVDALIAGSGTIAVTATERLDASITGSGSVIYAGRPAHVTSRVTGSGSVTPF